MNSRLGGYDIISVGNGFYDIKYSKLKVRGFWNTHTIPVNPNNKFCPNCLRDVSEVNRNRANRRAKKLTCPVCLETYKRLVDKESIRDMRLLKLLG
jgi:hypothetical protein